jgi:hypothetical protein
MLISPYARRSGPKGFAYTPVGLTAGRAPCDGRGESVNGLWRTKTRISQAHCLWH